MGWSSGEEEDLLIPPDNFSMVEPGIYRSGFPGKKNFPFLKSLQLRTVLYLCPEEYPEANLAFLTAAHVQLMQYGVMGNKEASGQRRRQRGEGAAPGVDSQLTLTLVSFPPLLLSFSSLSTSQPFLEIPQDILSLALLQILDTRNHPLLVHCNKGKHRTGCMIGILHKALGWSLSAIFDEYRVFSTPKERFVDQQWIESWQMDLPQEYREYLQQQHDLRQAGGSGGAIDATTDAAGRPLLLPPSPESKFLLNPEANEQPPTKQKEKAARAEPPSTTSHAMLHHAASEKSTAASMLPTTNRPLAHHAYAASQPNLTALAHGIQAHAPK